MLPEASSRRRRIYSDAPLNEGGYSRLNVGIFAGTFDPIHNGHLAAARLSAKQCLLDKVYFAVEAQPWGVKSPVKYKNRQEMVDLAISKDENIDQLVLEDKHFEVEKTLPKIEKTFKNNKLFFIFGADVFLKMNSSSWKNLNQLLKHGMIIFERGSITQKDISDHANNLGISVAILTSNKLDSSSSKIRSSVDINSDEIPSAVDKFIKENRLYQN